MLNFNALAVVEKVIDNGSMNGLPSDLERVASALGCMNLL
jgi:hypothetical protein